MCGEFRNFGLLGIHTVVNIIELIKELLQRDQIIKRCFILSRCDNNGHSQAKQYIKFIILLTIFPWVNASWEASFNSIKCQVSTTYQKVGNRLHIFLFVTTWSDLTAMTAQRLINSSLAETPQQLFLRNQTLPGAITLLLFHRPSCTFMANMSQ